MKLTNVTEPCSKLLFRSEKAGSTRHQGDFFFFEKQIAHLLSSLAALFEQFCSAIFEIGEKIKGSGSFSGFWKILFEKTFFSLLSKTCLDDIWHQLFGVLYEHSLRPLLEFFGNACCSSAFPLQTCTASLMPTRKYSIEIPKSANPIQLNTWMGSATVA